MIALTLDIYIIRVLWVFIIFSPSVIHIFDIWKFFAFENNYTYIVEYVTIQIFLPISVAASWCRQIVEAHSMAGRLSPVPATFTSVVSSVTFHIFALCSLRCVADHRNKFHTEGLFGFRRKPQMLQVVHKIPHEVLSVSFTFALNKYFEMVGKINGYNRMIVLKNEHNTIKL